MSYVFPSVIEETKKTNNPRTMLNLPIIYFMISSFINILHIPAEPNTVKKDNAEYLAINKQERQQREKIPRKIIREFIKNCNSSNYDAVVKDLSPDIRFEIRVNWRQN